MSRLYLARARHSTYRYIDMCCPPRRLQVEQRRPGRTEGQEALGGTTNANTLGNRSARFARFYSRVPVPNQHHLYPVPPRSHPTSIPTYTIGSYLFSYEVTICVSDHHHSASSGSTNPQSTHVQVSSRTSTSFLYSYSTETSYLHLKPRTDPLTPYIVYRE
jgi:hypothetical protein